MTVDVRHVNDIVGCARFVLNMAKHGMNPVFPDVSKIYEGLKKKLDEGT
ncbi:MAG: hypothetical protein LUC17_05325 [Oscillospiraceae bacterium]|nr:hypothetical protein [Oscillospiraceae bacterium]